MKLIKIRSQNEMDLKKLSDIGLIWIQNFLTHAEADAAVKNIPPTNIMKTKARNSTRRYGTQFPYEGGIIRGPVPEYLEALNRKIVENGLSTQTYQSISINEYLPGNSIAPHIDNRESGETIAIITLMGSAEIRFELDDIVYDLLLEPGSLIQMRGDSRWKWNHSIPAVREKRYSIVFRC